ncbi:cytochrome P450 9e2-like [Penaeus chinensis]|uniref:cytochrome P450 9e2-like n=1 Tax=Penaeus chinensis TaxID=139456 RepID=UPI001FB66D07|nr:cytochrome P450 9e2-like [Penaeus chinensis]XP_047493087.1 cytochrome P450 9e2-like [Penaeus chinensis]
MIGVTWLLLGAALALFWAYSWWKHRYWANKGVPTPPVVPFIGHAHKLFLADKRCNFEKEIYFNCSGSKLSGVYSFHEPVLLVGDPELMRHIFVKDFDHFMDRRTLNMPSEKDKVMANMLSLKTGEEWKKLRAIMSPTFTSGRMKGMFPLVCKKADDLVSFCLKEARTKPFVDMKYNFGRFTMDTIASCAFGIECNSLVGEKAEFAEKVETFFKMTPGMMCRLLFLSIFPRLGNLLNMRFSVPATDFFTEVARETMRTRQSGNKRGDFLDLLLEAEVSTGDAEGITATQDDSKSSQSKQALDELTIISQSVMFLVAGYDTTASTLAFASILLAKHPEIQQRLRQEISEIVEEHGDITYQGIMEAKYLDACVMETLRMYPPGLFLERKCVKEYKIPGTDVTIEPGLIVTCSIFNIQRDPKYWPEPEEFRPERFLPENKANITNLTHIPFGIGPRNCIAMRFALMETKVGLAKMLLASDMKLAPGHEEIKTDFGFGLLRPKDGVNLLLTPLKEE